jgi:dTDP-4-amino-4,6-dideoxygalactose transaminase
MINVFGSLVGKEEIEEVTNTLKSQWLGLGKKVEEFENQFSNKFNIANFAMVDSGSNALFLAIKLLNLPKKSEVIIPSFTWVSCAQAVLMCDLKPVFCDVDIESMNTNAELISKKITSNTSAIMVVHYAGLPVEMDDVMKLGLPVIEDAAHAVDSRYKGAQCGSIADIGIYSFDAVKNLTCAEGGGITTKNKDLLKRAKYLRYCGIGKSGFENSSLNSDKNWWEYEIREPFIKMLPNNITASIGIAQLKKIDALQQKRSQIWKFYQKNINNIVTKPQELQNKNDRHSFFTYCIRVNNRDKLANYLLKKEVYTTLRYHPLHLNQIYNQTDNSLPNTERLNKSALSLPIHPNMTLDDASYVVEHVNKFYNDSN